MDCLNDTPALVNLSQRMKEETSTSRAVDYVKYYIMDIAVPSVCALGLLGNLLSLMVLTTEKLHRALTKMEISAHIGLMALAVSDFLFCLLVLVFTQADIKQYYEEGDPVIYFDFVANGLITLFIISSTWLIVVMAAERYIAVCHPLQARKLISLRRTGASVVVVFLVCALCTIVIFLERTIVEVTCHDGRQMYILTERSQAFVRSRRIVWAVFYDVIPSAALVYFNLCLIIQIHKAKSLREQMTLKRSVILYSSSGNHICDQQLISTGNNALNDTNKSHTHANDSEKSKAKTPFMRSLSGFESSSRSLGHTSGRNKKSGLVGNTFSGEKRFKDSNVQGSSNNTPETFPAFNGARTERQPKNCQSFSMKLGVSNSRKRHSENALNSVTATLVSVVILFLVLVSPAELMKFSVSYMPADKDQKQIVTYLTNFMQVLNFSLNFVLYCAVNRSFRQTLRDILCCCWLSVHI